jgi:hypothetical protein
LKSLEGKGEEKGLPPGLKLGDRLWFNCGMLRISTSEKVGEFEVETLKSMESESGLREMQFECGTEVGTSLLLQHRYRGIRG